MPTVQQVIRELAKYALAKKGAQQDSSSGTSNALVDPHVEVPGGEWMTFFELDKDGTGPFTRLPVLRATLDRHRTQYPVIRESDWIERDGHCYMDVPLDAGLPLDFLKALIDEAHALVWSKLDADERLKVELAGLPYDEAKLLDRLLEMHDLKKHRKAIRKLARGALLLRTKKSSEAKIALGATKIGGRPDLAPGTEWPRYGNGKPLAFLAQLDLAEIAKLGTPLNGLPTAGQLAVFSVWGWMTEDDLDPQTPDDGTEPRQEEVGWTRAVYTPPGATLERAKAPRGVNSFKAAAVEPTPILSLPNHRSEPPLAALDWTDDEYERFDDLQSDFRSLQMGHWFKHSDSDASHHLLGGYALFQQQLPEEVLEKKLTMCLQIGTDDNAKMMWSDGGELTFYADPRALAKGRLERLWGTCQGG